MLQEYFRDILQGLYSVFKKSDRFIKFTFLTGVTCYGKLGIFSAANNLNDISMSKKYASICGITEDELRPNLNEGVVDFAEEEAVSCEKLYSLLKKKYDGYHFCEKSVDIYNPFSLLNALESKQLRDFWFSTGTPTYLAKILKEKAFDLTSLSEEVEVTAESMSSFGSGESNVIAALYQSGYLTIKGRDADGIYTLVFPNEEVADGFVKYLAVEFTDKD